VNQRAPLAKLEMTNIKIRMREMWNLESFKVLESETPEALRVLYSDRKSPEFIIIGRLAREIEEEAAEDSEDDFEYEDEDTEEDEVAEDEVGDEEEPAGDGKDEFEDEDSEEEAKLEFDADTADILQKEQDLYKSGLYSQSIFRCGELLQQEMDKSSIKESRENHLRKDKVNSSVDNTKHCSSNTQKLLGSPPRYSATKPKGMPRPFVLSCQDSRERGQQLNCEQLGNDPHS
jgi:hypothetical protein